MSAPADQLGIGLFDDRFIQDPYPLYEEMLRRGPVHAIGDSGFYAVCSWDAVAEAVGRPEDFSSNLTATMTYRDGAVGTFDVDRVGGPTQALATADDPAHATHRKLLVPKLAAKRIRELEPLITETEDRLWNEGARDGTIQWMAAMANRLPMIIVGRLIGVPDQDIEQLARWGYAATKLVEGLVDDEALAAAGVAVTELADYISEQFRQAAANPKDNLLGGLAIACASNELADVTALTIMATLFSAGGESTASLIGSAAHILANHQSVQKHVRDNPHLLDDFLEEVLRYESPFRGHYRHVLHDTSLCGVDLPAGSRLLLLWGAANRDPSHFDAPDEFRLQRPGSKGHIAFGKGAHFCVGAALARLEARVVIGQLLARTTRIEAVDTGRWLPSLLVRRLERLQLQVA